MKHLMLFLATVLTTLELHATLPQPDLIAEIHFAGGDRIFADKNYFSFTNEFSSPEALALRQQTADKLTPWLAGWQLGTVVPNGAAKLRPLLDDLQAAEWFLEARAATGGQPDVAIAIKLAPARAQAWQTALQPFFPMATFKQSAGWLIFDSGTGAVKLGDTLLQKISLPTTGWLSFDINWPHLAQWYPALKSLGLPETKFGVTAPDANLHLNGKFFFPENLAIKLDPWRFPSNTVHQPFVSFTAVRGFADWLNGQDWAQPIRLSPPANQIFAWALNGMPFQCYAAVPVADANSALDQVDAGLQTIIANRNAHDGFITPFTLDMTNTELSLIGNPIIVPFIKTITESSGKFLLAGGFPNSLKSKPLPLELFQRLAQPNLVFYHWEITARRLPQELNLTQLALMLTLHKQLDGDSAAYHWIATTSSTLGNTVTEITQTAPDQLTFTRTAPGGLTAVEFLTLANWLDAPDFPHCSLSVPPNSERLNRLNRLRVKHANPQSMPAPIH